MSSYLRDIGTLLEIEKDPVGVKLYDRLGGRPTLERVHRIFYDKIYAHPWIGKFFAHVPQAHIESQQSDFMALLMGGPKSYSGRMPIDAHMHMYITEDLFAVRHGLLLSALIEAGIPEKERADWLRLDAAFKRGLLKKSIADCTKRFKMDEIVDHPDPSGYSKAS